MEQTLLAFEGSEEQALATGRECRKERQANPGIQAKADRALEDTLIVRVVAKNEAHDTKNSPGSQLLQRGGKIGQRLRWRQGFGRQVLSGNLFTIKRQRPATALSRQFQECGFGGQGEARLRDPVELEKRHTPHEVCCIRGRFTQSISLKSDPGCGWQGQQFLFDNVDRKTALALRTTQ